MEGEGLTAVIRGLPDGTALVLMQRHLQDLGDRRLAGRRGAKPRRCWELDAPTRLRNVEAGTLTDRTSVNAPAQACDGHYASTYQLAHCSVLPTSPAVDLPEFPLQRSEPCRTQGNFEVGGLNYRSRSPSPTSFDGVRGMSLDRGSRGARAPDREAELFASSLRRYPTAPERPPTAELLQRLIKQAQDKYNLKTQPTKSIREKTSPISLHGEKPSKNLQTYTRSRREPCRLDVRAAKRFRSGFTSPAPGCSREISETSLFASGSRRGPQGARAAAPPPVPYEPKHVALYLVTVHTARDTFEYLNSAVPRPAPGAASGDRRVRDSIRHSLRQVFGDARGPVATFPVCPKILSRYEKHRREHHVCDEPSTSRVDEACGSLNSLPWGATCGIPEVTTSTPVENQLVCCKCDRPLPCACKPSPICYCRESRASEDEIQEKRKLEEIVCSWLDDLPVSAKEKPQDKYIRDALIKKLIDTLAAIKEDEFDTKGREEIEQCIDKMPMWYPSDNREREKVRKDLVDSLFDRIKGFRRRDRFKDVIAKWLDTIDFVKDLDKNDVVDDFTKALKDIALDRPSNDSIYRDKLKCKIFDLLQALPIEANVDKDDLVNLKSEQLADQLVRLPKNVVKPDSYSESGSKEKEAAEQFEIMKQFAKKIADREFGGIILNALNEIDGLRDIDEEKKQVAIKELISNLPNLLSDDEECVAKEMYDQIHDWLMTLAADNGVHIDDKTKRAFIDDLVDKLEDSLMTHLQLGESMTGFLSDLPKPEKTPEQRKIDESLTLATIDKKQYSSGKSRRDEAYPSKQMKLKEKSNISDSRYPIKQPPNDQSYPEDDDKPTGQRNIGGKRSKSPQQYSTGKRRTSDQSYINDQGSPTSIRSSNKRSPSPLRYPTGKRRPSDQSYLDDEGSPTSQKGFSGKRTQSPQQYPTGKRRTSDQSYLGEEGSPPSQLGSSGKKSPSPPLQPAGKRHIDQSYPGDEGQGRKTRGQEEGKLSITQRGFNGKRSQSPQQSSTGKSRTSYLEDEGSPTSYKSFNGKISQSPQQHSTRMRIQDDQSYASDERSINYKRSPSLQRYSSDGNKTYPGREVPINPHVIDKPHPSKSLITDSNQRTLSDEAYKGGKTQGHLKGSKISGQEKNTEKARQRDQGYLSDDSMSSDQQNIKGYQSNRNQKGISKKAKPSNKLDTRDQINVSSKEQPSQSRGGSQIIGQRNIDDRDYSSGRDNVNDLSIGQANVRDVTQQSKHNVDQTQLRDQDRIGNKLDIDSKSISKRDGQNIGNETQLNNRDYDSDKPQTVRKDMNDIGSHRKQVPLLGISEVDQGNVNAQGQRNGQSKVSDQRNIQDKPQANTRKKDPRSQKSKADIDDDVNLSNRYLADDDRVESSRETKDGIKPHMKEESKKTVQKIKDWLNHYREKAGFLPGVKSVNKEESSGRRPRHSVQAGELESTEDFPEKFARRSSDLQVKKPVTRRRVSFSSSDDDELLNLTNDDPELKKVLKSDVHGILDLTGGSFGNIEDVESQLADLLADLVMRGIDEDSVRDQILSILGPGVSIEEADEIYNKLIECANEMSRSTDPDGTPNFTRPSATSTPRKQLQVGRNQHEQTPMEDTTSSQTRRQAENDYKNEQVPKVKEWLTNHSTLNNDADIDVVARELANDFVDRQKYLQLNPDAKTSPGEELENMKYQVYKRLNKLLDTEKINAVMPKVPILMNSIKKIPVPKLTKVAGEFVQEGLVDAISDWIKKSPLYKKQNEKQKAMLNKVAPDLASAITSALQTSESGTTNEDSDKMLLGEIVKHLKKPLPPKQISITSLQEMGNDLLKHLKDLEFLPDNLNRSDQVLATSPISQFNNAVTKWCNDLPFPNTEQGTKARQDMANKIMAKVGELNMNPQILNDDFLYEDILSDFIDQQLNSIPGNINNKNELKSELMNEVNKLRQPLKEKMAGQAYKQKLRDTVPKTLPSIENPTEADEASFEIMKDNLADAFINLNYVGGDTALKEKFKNKINDEIGKFADNYMNRRPNTPLSTSQLKKDLLSAMKKVDVPGDESMKSEVEKARMRDIIDDWAKELPLKEQTPVEQLHTNNILKAMTQRLHDLEKENELSPSDDYDEKLEKEIRKYVKKLPVSETANLDESSRKLAEKIKATEHSRTFAEGSRRSIDVEDYPSPSVGAEDRAHLQRIRERNGKFASNSGLCRYCKSFIVQSRSFEPCCKDAAVNPAPVDHGSQTDMATKHSQSAQCRCSTTEIPRPVASPCSSRSQIRTIPCSRPRPRVSTGSQVHISPYIIVKEYGWNEQPVKPITDCPSQASLHSISRNRCNRLGGVTPDASYTIPCREKDTNPGSFDNIDYRDPSPPRRRHTTVKDSFDCRPIPSQPCCHYLPRKVWSRPHIYRDNDPTRLPKDPAKCGCRGQVPKCKQVTKCPGPVPKCPGQMPKCPRQMPKCRRKTIVTCQTCLDDPMKLCPKCCGVPCPHPTNFFFN